jgi:hypothetical protein
LQVSVSEAPPPPSEPAKSAFLRFRAIGRIRFLDHVAVDLDAAVVEEADQSRSPASNLLYVEMGFSPQLQGKWKWIDVDTVPPSYLIAASVKFPVMHTAERNRVLVTHPPTKSARLSETEMVCVARRAAADDAGLTGDEPPVFFVPQPNDLRKRRSNLVT